MHKVLLDYATSLLTKNTVTVSTIRNNVETRAVYTSPSPGTYDQQWFWDSCLHSLVWIKLGKKDRAFQEIQSLIVGKGKKEFIPHMIFWKKKRDIYWWIFDNLYQTDYCSELIQPPIIGVSLKKLKNAGIKASEMDKLLDVISSHYDYILRKRDPEKMGLISIVHPWESGLDSAPCFDLSLENKNFLRMRMWQRMRNLLKEFQILNWNQREMAKKSSFRVKCVLTNTLLAWGMDSFADVLEEMNRVEQANDFRDKADHIWHSLMRYCWNEKDGLFYSLEMKKNNFNQIRISSISSLIPLLLEISSDIKERLLEHLLDENKYWSKYPIPTVSMSEKTFNPKSNQLLWRGPTWINTNFFIWLGLKKNKETKIANELAERTYNLVQKSGFREYYNPLTGKGGGANDFGWSTLVTLMNVSK